MGSYFPELTRDVYVFLQYYMVHKNSDSINEIVKPRNPYTEDGEVTFLFPI